MGNVGHQEQDNANAYSAIPTSSIFERGRYLVEDSASPEGKDIKRVLNTKLYTKAYDLVKLLSNGGKDLKVVTALQHYYSQEKRIGINLENAYFIQQSIRLLKIVQSSSLSESTYESLMRNYLFQHLICFLAFHEFPTIDHPLYHHARTLAQWLAYSQPHYFTFKAWQQSQYASIDYSYDDNYDNLEAQVFIFFEAMDAMRNARIDLSAQLRDPLFRMMLDNVGNKLCGWLKKEKMIHANDHLYSGRFYYIHQHQHDNFNPILHGHSLSDTLDLLQLNLNYFHALENDIGYLAQYSADSVNLFRLKTIVQKWQMLFKHHPQFSLSDVIVQENNRQTVLDRLFATWNHFKENTDFSSNYSKLLLLIDRWNTQTLDDNNLNRVSTLEAIDYCYTHYIKSDDDQQVIDRGYSTRLYFLNYLFPRIYAQQNYILSGKAAQSELIQKHVTQLDREIYVVLKRYPDLLGSLSHHFWQKFGNANVSYDDEVSSSNKIEEPTSPKSGTSVNKMLPELKFFKHPVLVESESSPCFSSDSSGNDGDWSETPTAVNSHLDSDDNQTLVGSDSSQNEEERPVLGLGITFSHSA